MDDENFSHVKIAVWVNSWFVSLRSYFYLLYIALGIVYSIFHCYIYIYIFFVSINVLI